MFIPELPPGIAPGFEFNPSNELLITKYLKPKILGTDPDVDLIVPEIDCCKFEPRELPAKSKIKSKDKCLFFSEEKMEYKIDKKWKITNGRTTKEGFWKITCKERVIKDEETEECIGKKRILTFYRGSSASKEKTNWVMHQYYIFPDHPLPNQKICVLCYVKKQQDNKANSPDRGEGEPSSTATSEIENHVPPAATSVAHGHEEEHWESYSGACNFTEDEDLDFLLSIFLDPDEEPGLATNSCIPQASSWKRGYGDGLVGGETDTEGGVDGGGKRPRSLARGEIH